MGVRFQLMWLSRSIATRAKKCFYIFVWLSMISFLFKESNMHSALDKEYSPSLWSKRFSNREEVITSHVNFVNEESVRVRNTFKYETIFYGTKTNENFDLFGLNLPSDAPIFVYIHGGYWQQLTKEMSAYSVDPLVSNGFKVIIVEYDLCPAVTLSEVIQQIIECGEFISRYAERSKCRQLTFCGHSTGAHLILCMIDNLMNRAPECLQIHSLYLISGIYDLTELQHTSINQENLLSIDASKVNELSPLKFDYKKWSDQQFSVNIYIAEHDSPTFIKQSLKLFNSLEAIKLKVRVRFIENCDHFEIVENLSEQSFDIVQDLIRSV